MTLEPEILLTEKPELEIIRIAGPELTEKTETEIVETENLVL